MRRQIIKGQIVHKDEPPYVGYIVIENETMVSITKHKPTTLRLNTNNQKIDKFYDFEKNYIIPGLIEQHTHGAMGNDFINGSIDGNITIGKYLVSQAITAVVPTLITNPTINIKNAVKAINSCTTDKHFLPEIKGIFFEGPFINKKKKGVHNEANIKLPNLKTAKMLIDLPKKNLKKIILIAPELPNALNLIKTLTQKGVIVTGGHTMASYDDSYKAINHGMTGVTHLWNAMSSYHHREPGLPGAAFASNKLTCELICDFLHVHKEIVRDTIKRKGIHKIALISDMTGPGGLKDGVYKWDGRNVSVSTTNGIRLIDKNQNEDSKEGLLAGSNLNTKQMFQNILSLGFTINDFVTMRSTTPAKFLKLPASYGTLTKGAQANISVLSPSGEPIATIIKGNVVFIKTS